MNASEHLDALAALLREVEDVLGGRVTAPAAPRWARERGWTEFLLGLDEATLEACERAGPAGFFESAADAPPSLRELAGRVRRLTALPGPIPPASAPVLRQASPSKRAQVAGLTALVRRWAPATRRVVDLGAGKGHLTRALAAALAVPAVGVERDHHVVRRARDLTFDERVRFVRGDAGARGGGVEPGPADLLVGLHACGALGDALVERAADSGAGVLLVSCCYQKVPGGARSPLSARGAALGLALATAHLGLANLATAHEGAAGGAGVMSRRHTRYALWLALRDAGVELPLGDEARGVNRRQFRRPLEDLAPEVFAARGLTAPSAETLRQLEARAREEHGRVRRLALPRTMLARPLELAVVLDRAAALAETAGPEPSVVEGFARSASPRNVALLRQPAAETSAASS